MKLSKSPDINNSLHKRSQKCVFKKMKFPKSPDIKILYTEGLKNACSKIWSSQKVLLSKKNVCSKKWTLKKSWYQNFSRQNVSKMCVQKNEALKKSWYQQFSTQKVSKMCVQKNETLKKSWYQQFSAQKVSKMCVQKNEIPKKSWYQNSLHRRSQKCVFKKWNSQKVLISKFL